MAAHLSEHRGPVNQLRVSPDHNFFASCSDDGTIKIWDTQRLERNVTNRARLTYSQQGRTIFPILSIPNTTLKEDVFSLLPFAKILIA